MSTCKHCKSEFLPRIRGKKPATYCSWTCYQEAVKAKIDRCKKCDKEFVHLSKGKLGPQKYCSKQCYHEAIRIWDRCEHCGEMFRHHATQTQSGRQRFCSRDCFQNANSKTMQCTQCQQAAKVPRALWKTFRFCSRTCQAIWHARNKIIEKKCQTCSEAFKIAPRYSRAKFCSKRCRVKAWNAGRKPYSEGGGSKMREWMRSQGLMESCERCSYSQEPRILVVHHKSRDRHDNSPANLEVLCPNCHALEHLR